MPALLLNISRFCAFSLLCLSLLFPWLRVPVGITEFTAGNYVIHFSEPVTTIAFKAFVLVLLLSLCAWRLRHRRSYAPVPQLSPFCAGGIVILMAIIIVYPALTMQRCAVISAHASWLQDQSYSLIQPNGDAFNAQEYFYESGQPTVGVKEVLPRSFTAMPTPILNSFSDLHLAKLEDCVSWLGLSQSFCVFARRGWFCGIFGAFLLAVSFGRPNGSVPASAGGPRKYPFIRLFALFGACFLYLLCLCPVVIAGHELAKAQSATLEGNFRRALEDLDLAEVWLPVFAYETDLIYQRGWLERKLGFNSPFVQVFSAIREEEESFDTRAAQHYSELLETQNPGPVRSEAYRGALRLALKDFNSGAINRAAVSLKKLSEIDPSCIKAYYALGLADLQKLQKEQLESDTAKFEAVYRCFQTLEKSSLIASAHRRVAELEFDYRDIPRLGTEMRAAIKP